MSASNRRRAVIRIRTSSRPSPICSCRFRRRIYWSTRDSIWKLVGCRRWWWALAMRAESRIRGRSAEQRRAVRQAQTRPLVEALRAWLENRLMAVSDKSSIAAAIRYGFNHWDGLVRFLDDGRIEMDTNSVERAMRPIALNRKNSVFAGHDEGAVNWACIASLIETAKLHGIDPQAY